MKIKKTVLMLILALLTSQSMAEINFVKYKKYLIPITPSSPECLKISNNKPNVIYIDDIGEVTSGLGSTYHPDPNGVQDLAIVLGLGINRLGIDKNINLLAIGVGIPGKQISNVAARSQDVQIAKDIVANSSHGLLPLEEHIPVHSGEDLLDVIELYANCSSSNNRLVIANGGPVYDLYNVLNRTKPVNSTLSSLADKVKIIMVKGSNDSDATHPMTSPQGQGANAIYGDVKNLVGAGNYEEIIGSYVIYSDSNGGAYNHPYTASYMNNYYDSYIAPVLNGVIDSQGDGLNSSKYKTNVQSINGAVGAHYLRFGDMPAVAKAFGAWNCDIDVTDPSEPYQFTFPKNDQKCMLDNIQIALMKAKQ